MKAFKVADIDKEYRLSYEKVIKWIDVCTEFKNFVNLFQPAKVVINV